MFTDQVDQNQPVMGRVCELLVCEDLQQKVNSRRHLVTLERFICSDSCHPEFRWPVLRRPEIPASSTSNEATPSFGKYCVVKAQVCSQSCYK